MYIPPPPPLAISIAIDVWRRAHLQDAKSEQATRMSRIGRLNVNTIALATNRLLDVHVYVELLPRLCEKKKKKTSESNGWIDASGRVCTGIVGDGSAMEFGPESVGFPAKTRGV